MNKIDRLHQLRSKRSLNQTELVELATLTNELYPKQVVGSPIDSIQTEIEVLANKTEPSINDILKQKELEDQLKLEKEIEANKEAERIHTEELTAALKAAEDDKLQKELGSIESSEELPTEGTTDGESSEELAPMDND